jgi:multicomponent Na+:H+ antiporter subunit B
MMQAITAVILSFMGITAIAMMRLRSVFAVVMLASLYSLLTAAVFVTMDAADVAFTEAAVGAGISTVLMLATLRLTTRASKPPTHRSGLPLAVILLTGGTLIYGTLDLPDYGDPRAVSHQHVAAYYLEQTPTQIGIPNVVTAILASYRGYDTLGETAVIFTAGIGVYSLLRRLRAYRSP